MYENQRNGPPKKPADRLRSRASQRRRSALVLSRVRPPKIKHGEVAEQLRGRLGVAAMERRAVKELGVHQFHDAEERKFPFMEFPTGPAFADVEQRGARFAIVPSEESSAARSASSGPMVRSKISLESSEVR